MIAGLGEKTDFVATVPNVDATKLNLTPEESALFARIGRASQISSVISQSGHPEPRAIALLLSLRAKGAVVPARVTKGSFAAPSAAAAMSEDVELTEERKREILAMELALETKNHFEVMGVPVGAPPEAVRQAFYELSRKFHPDRYFQKNLGSFRARIELVYRKLSSAYETLYDEDKRKAYLQAHPGLETTDRSRTAAVPLAKAPEAPKPRTSEDDARESERRSRFARHPYFAKGARITELLSRAKEHIAKNDYGHAFTDLHMAHQIDGTNDEVNKLLVEVRAKNDVARSAVDLKRGLEDLDQGKESSALVAFRSAVNIDPKNAKAAFMAAKMIWDKTADSKEASGFAQKAVDADPKNADAHVLLARILDASGMKVIAKKHFEEALKLDPKNAEAKKHVKGRWPF